jgi:hypothetical protein
MFQHLFRSLTTMMIDFNHIFYPFTAPAVIPSIKYFWKQMKRTKIGTMEKKQPTINKS